MFRQASTRMALAATIALAVTACSSGSPTAKSPPTTRPAASTTTAPRSTGPSVIIDTDFSRWWDDATVIGMANSLQNQGAVNVLGIASDIPNPVAVAAIDAVDTAYGNASLPLAAVAHSDADTAKHGFSDVLAARLPHAVQSSADVPQAVSFYRDVLTKQPDRSVTVVALGSYTNLAALLASDGGPKLVRDKVKRLVIMDGVFPGGLPPVTNQKLDLAAATAVVSGARGVGPWPTPIAWVDGLDGIGTRVGATLCTKAAADNPMRIVYESLFECGPPGDGDWDAPAFLYAIGDIPDAFTALGRGGQAVINAQGGLSWQAKSTKPDDVYVHLANQQLLNTRIDQLLLVAAQPNAK